MTIRQVIQDKKSVGVAVGASMVLAAAVILFASTRREAQANLEQAFFSTDDGKTWFPASVYQLAPFQHEGKEAVQAAVFTYAGGSKKFCAYLTKFTPEGKKKLEEAMATAKAQGKPPESVTLFRDRAFMQGATLIKPAGTSGPWIPMSDPKSAAALSVRSPDGSEHDQLMVY